MGMMTTSLWLASCGSQPNRGTVVPTDRQIIPGIGGWNALICR
jgi:hypothetical protein